LPVLGFKGAYPAFPDDTTLNQFYDEARFEAYPELGFACVEQIDERSDHKQCIDYNVNCGKSPKCGLFLRFSTKHKNPFGKEEAMYI